MKRPRAFWIEELLEAETDKNEEQQRTNGNGGSRAKRSRKGKGGAVANCEEEGGHHSEEKNWLEANDDPPLLRELKCELENWETWEEFDKLGTEMIITKSGRRMFPVLRVRLFGTRPGFFYLIYLDLVPVQREHRFRYAYNKSQWQSAGKADEPQLGRLYLHTDSPISGEQLAQPGTVLSFDKAKLTNNPNTHALDQLLLNSMHKYRPRIHVLCLPKGHPLLADPPKEFCTKAALLKLANLQYKTFSFPKTTFVAVTAYQNQLVTQKKIELNPFAKGFRDQKAADGMDERLKCPLIPSKSSPPPLISPIAPSSLPSHSSSSAFSPLHLRPNPLFLPWHSPFFHYFFLANQQRHQQRNENEGTNSPLMKREEEGRNQIDAKISVE